MKIIIVRHGDPDYEKDSLTELGWKEAEALSERMKNIKADECYVSPLGRAKDTASLSLEKMNMEAVELKWLREFAPVVKRPEKTGVAWDWLPKDWTNMPYAFDFDKWTDYPALKDAGVREEVDWIYSEFDKFLEKHGYKKEGKLFKVLNPNSDVIVFFCHFGLESILLGHLLHLPVMPLWHGTCALTTSVTKVTTEERQDGTACFRMLYFGALPHLWEAGIEPAFAARYVECFEDEGRH